MATSGNPEVGAAEGRVGRYRWVICGLLFAATATAFGRRAIITDLVIGFIIGTIIYVVPAGLPAAVAFVSRGTRSIVLKLNEITQVGADLSNQSSPRWVLSRTISVTKIAFCLSSSVANNGSAASATAR